MDITIIVAVITSVGTIIAGVFGGFDKIFKNNKDEEEKEEEMASNISSLKITFESFSELNSSINDLFNKTSADRFLLLISNNEGEGYNWVSAIYEQHFNSPDAVTKKNIALSIGATGRYVKLDMDSDYKLMIEDARKSSPVKLTVPYMKDSILKNIYLYEKVTHSNVYFLYDIIRKINGKKQITTLFCSIAKHGEHPFLAEDETYMKLVVDKIKNDIIPNKRYKNAR